MQSSTHLLLLAAFDTFAELQALLLDEKHTTLTST